jgi:hypothetical protein
MSEQDSPKAFLRRAAEAFLRIVVMAIFGLAHWLLEKGIGLIIPENMKPTQLWIQDISFCAFIVIYGYLLWDMLAVFIPRLHQQPYRPIEAEDEAS